MNKINNLMLLCVFTVFIFCGCVSTFHENESLFAIYDNREILILYRALQEDDVDVVLGAYGDYSYLSIVAKSNEKFNKVREKALAIIRENQIGMAIRQKLESDTFDLYKNGECYGEEGIRKSDYTTRVFAVGGGYGHDISTLDKALQRDGIDVIQGATSVSSSLLMIGDATRKHFSKARKKALAIIRKEKMSIHIQRELKSDMYDWYRKGVYYETHKITGFKGVSDIDFVPTEADRARWGSP